MRVCDFEKHRSRFIFFTYQNESAPAYLLVPQTNRLDLIPNQNLQLASTEGASPLSPISG